MASDGTARFTVALTDETTGAANAAAGALDNLRQKIERDQSALRALEAAQKNLNKGTVVNIQAYKSLSDQIASKRNAIASATEDFVRLGGSFNKLPKKPPEGLVRTAKELSGLAIKPPKGVRETEASFDSLARETKKIGLGLPDTISDIGGAVSTLPGFLITASAALVTFSAAVAGLAIGGLVSLFKFAITAQEELEGVSQAAINVAKRSPIARTEIAKLSDELEKTGLRGEALEVALEKAVTKKFGKDATKSMMGFSVQIAKAKENVALLFTGLKFDALANAFAKLLSFLDASTTEGQALKTLLETLLQPIINGLAAAGPSAKKFFQGMIIGALEVAIAILLVKKRLESIIGYKLDLKAIDWTTVGEAVAFAAAAFGLAAVAIGAVVGIILGSVAAVGVLAFAFGVVLVKVGEAVAGIPAALTSLNNFIISRVAAMVDAGFQFAAGLADGIRNGISEVITAATDVANGAIDAVKKTLKISSPSKVGLDFGDNFGGAIATGAERSGADVEGAATGLGEALIPPQQGGALPQTSASTSPTIQIDQLIVNGVEGADDPSFPAKLAETLQQALALAGMAPA